MSVRSSEESVSVFLDILRFSAALFVFAAHATWEKFSNWPRFTGHDAVIVFFVLSGYVIALTTERKDENFRQYAVARFARLYSVVIPALLLTYAADGIGRHLNPAIYDMPQDYAVGRLLAAATYTSQIWFLDIRTLSNAPYWSLPYEFWFYALWGLGFYLAGKQRTVFLALTALIAGPKLLLYLPIWLLGVAVYRMRGRSFGKLGAHIGILAGLACLPLLYSWGVDTRFDAVISDGVMSFTNTSFLPHGFSICDYIFGGVIALIVVLFPSTGLDLAPLKKPVRFFAGRTFSLYLYHFPLLHFYAAVLPSSLAPQTRAVLIAGLAFGTSLLLANVTELRKDRYARFFDRILPRSLEKAEG